MLTLVIILSLLIACLSAALFWSVRLNLRYADKLEEISDQLDESLDILDTLYQRAAARAQLEVFHDDPVVKELVNDIQTTRDAILLVANLIVEPLKEDDEEPQSR
jgi:hypothetical protein